MTANDPYIMPPKRARIRTVLINAGTEICRSFSPWPQLEARSSVLRLQRTVPPLISVVDIGSRSQLRTDRFDFDLRLKHPYKYLRGSPVIVKGPKQHTWLPNPLLT